MLNRYLLIGRSVNPPVLLVVLIGIVLLTPSLSAFPAQRRTFGLMDRLIRANPFRSLANFFNQKLSMDLYYPPFQQVHPFVAMRMPGGSSLATPTHYVKMPSSWQPVYYMPPAGLPMTTSSVAMLAPVTKQPVQLQQQQYFLHGVSYPLGSPEEQDVQPAVSSYHQPVPFEANQQNNILEGAGQNYLSSVASSSPPPVSAYQAGNQNQVESLTNQQSIHSAANYLDYSSGSEQSIATGPGGNSQELELQLRPPTEYHTEEDEPSPVGNSQSIKIVVIRPSDLQNQNVNQMEEQHSHQGEDFPSKDYTMKYIELGSSPGLHSNGQVAPEEADDAVHEEHCVEPMCDPFLRKLIPELLASSSFQHNQEGSGEPIVIVKSDNETTVPVDYSISYLANHNFDTGNNNQNQFTLSESNDVSKADPLHAQQSTLRPKRVHFPRKLISAKINSTSLRKYEPKSKPRQCVSNIHKKLQKFVRNYHLNKSTNSASGTAASKSSSEDDNGMMAIPRVFEVERSYPYYRYGSNAAKLRITRSGASNVKVVELPPSPSSSTIHYTAGVIFNSKLKSGISN